MYYYLTGEIKKRIIDELKDSFEDNIQHQDIVPHIRHKYDFEERPKKGIIVQGASGDPERLSSDNFLGNISSYVMFAQVGDYPGKALEWVREDTNAIKKNNGHMPAEPGIYYIEIDADEDSDGRNQYKFHVDPLRVVREEPLIEFETGNESNAFLMNGEVLEDSVRLRLARTNFQLVRGKALKVEATESLFFGPDDDDTFLFGLPEGYVPVSALGTSSEPFMFQANTNEHFLAYFNGRKVEFDFPVSTLSADEVVSEIDSRLKSTLVPDDYKVENRGGQIYLEASQSLRFADHSSNTAGQVLGLPEGQINPSVTGTIFPEGVPEQNDFRIEVDGTVQQFPIDGGDRSPEDIAQELDDNVDDVTITLVDGGDYKVDPSTGKITFLRSFESGDAVYASYKYPVESKTDLPIEPNHSNNTAIPGCVLAFGEELKKGDKMAVVVYPNRVNTASAYGGKWTINLDMQILTQDPSTRERLADLTMMYLFVQKKEKLAEEGIVIQNVSYGGEAEEFYDEQAQIYWYLADISLTILADWEVHIPKPFYIERVSGISFDELAEASHEDREPKPNLIQPTSSGSAVRSYDEEQDEPQNKIY